MPLSTPRPRRCRFVASTDSGAVRSTGSSALYATHAARLIMVSNDRYLHENAEMLPAAQDDLTRQWPRCRSSPTSTIRSRFGPLSIIEAAEGVCPGGVGGGLFQAGGGGHFVALLRKFGPVIDSSDGASTRCQYGCERSSLTGCCRCTTPTWCGPPAGRALQLPFHSRDAALKLTDKSAQRDALALAGLGRPDVRDHSTKTRRRPPSPKSPPFTYPAVLKPRFGQASRDTLPISSGSELQRPLRSSGSDPTGNPRTMFSRRSCRTPARSGW